MNFLFHLKLIIVGIYFDIFSKYFFIEGLKFTAPEGIKYVKLRGYLKLNLYERRERQYLGKYLSSKAKILELGGGLGIISCIANGIIDDRNCHLVIEPNKFAFKYLLLNRELNKAKFKVECCVVSKQKGNIFYHHPRIHSSSTKRESNSISIVEGRTIEELQKTHKIDFDTLIMDIEGGEYEFLISFGEFLNQINMIFLEIHDYMEILNASEVNACLNVLHNAGFENILTDKSFQIWKKQNTL